MQRNIEGIVVHLKQLQGSIHEIFKRQYAFLELYWLPYNLTFLKFLKCFLNYLIGFLDFNQLILLVLIYQNYELATIISFIQLQIPIMMIIVLAELFLIHLACSLHSRFNTVAIVVTNDIHGRALPTVLHRPGSNQMYEYGGLYYMASMIQRLKDQYKGNMLYVDSGDQFQGSLQSSPIISNGEIINDYFNIVPVSTSAIGNHQFDFGPDFLQSFMRERSSNSYFLAANVKSKTQGKKFLPNQVSTKIYKLSSGIKIGLIGLTTKNTYQTIRIYEENPYQNLIIDDYLPAILKQSKKLRQQGVHAIVLNCHIGNACTSDEKYGIWQESTKQNGECSTTDEISKLLKAIPLGTIDAVAQGHRHNFSHHFIQGVPVAGTIDGGYYFNVIYLKFFNKKIFYKHIEGPIPVCHKIFKNRNTCNYITQSQAQTAGELIPMKFHGRAVQPHKKLKELYQKWIPLMLPYEKQLAYTEILLKPSIRQENDLGNLLADLLMSAVPQANFAIISPFVFRTTWYPGVITYRHLYSMFPNDYNLISFDITGKELIQILKTVQVAKTSHYYTTKGLKETVRRYENGTLEYVNATWANGTQIDPLKIYRGASSGILMKGDNDFKNVVGTIYTLRNATVVGVYRQKMMEELVKIKRIKENTLYHPQNPRLRIITG